MNTGNSKLLKMIKGQLRKLNSKDFDLEAWKSSTIALLGKAFGADDPMVQEIQKLKIDYGSWALRDAKASYDPIETCKKVGREVVEIAVEQLESGEVRNTTSQSIVEEELKEESTARIISILKSHKSPAEKEDELKNILKTIEQDKLASILSRILTKDQ